MDFKWGLIDGVHSKTEPDAIESRGGPLVAVISNATKLHTIMHNIPISAHLSRLNVLIVESFTAGNVNDKTRELGDLVSDHCNVGHTQSVCQIKSCGNELAMVAVRILMRNRH